jgi:carbamoyl-phosphate synthase large subunit
VIVALTHFRELDAWQVAMQLAKQVYELSATFPREERYGLTSQIQRSAVSIPSNIAEGNARASTRDYARFVSIAQGSCAELQTQLLLVQDLVLGNHAMLVRSLELCDRVGQMLLRLHQSLDRRLKAESRVPSPESR